MVRLIIDFCLGGFAALGILFMAVVFCVSPCPDPSAHVVEIYEPPLPTVEIPGDGVDNDGDGLVDEEGG